MGKARPMTTWDCLTDALNELMYSAQATAPRIQTRRERIGFAIRVWKRPSSAGKAEDQGPTGCTAGWGGRWTPRRPTWAIRSGEVCERQTPRRRIRTRSERPTCLGPGTTSRTRLPARRSPRTHSREWLHLVTERLLRARSSALAGLEAKVVQGYSDGMMVRVVEPPVLEPVPLCSHGTVLQWPQEGACEGGRRVGPCGSDEGGGGQAQAHRADGPAVSWQAASVDQSHQALLEIRHGVSPSVASVVNVPCWGLGAPDSTMAAPEGRSLRAATAFLWFLCRAQNPVRGPGEGRCAWPRSICGMTAVFIMVRLDMVPERMRCARRWRQRETIWVADIRWHRAPLDSQSILSSAVACLACGWRHWGHLRTVGATATEKCVNDTTDIQT